jgi:hypothetical protein
MRGNGEQMIIYCNFVNDVNTCCIIRSTYQLNYGIFKHENLENGCADKDSKFPYPITTDLFSEECPKNPNISLGIMHYDDFDNVREL